MFLHNPSDHIDRTAFSDRLLHLAIRLRADTYRSLTRTDVCGIAVLDKIAPLKLDVYKPRLAGMLKQLFSCWHPTHVSLDAHVVPQSLVWRNCAPIELFDGCATLYRLETRRG